MFFYILDIPIHRIKKIKTVNYIFKEHNLEFNRRFYFLISFFSSILLFIILNNKDLAKILESAASSTVKFFQASPNDYFFSSIKLSVYVGLLATVPILVLQIITFFIPGFSKKEKFFSFPLSILSIILFISSILTSLFVLLPVTFLFFLNYNEGLLEPFWSFTEYFDFILTILLGTGIIFQLPIIQFLLNSLKIINLKKMVSGWKIVVLLSTIFGAIITPSTDPLSQLLLSSIIILLYLLGIGLIKISNKFFNK